MRVTKQIEITIIMDSNDAKWLKDIMRDPLHNNESLHDREMREMFWGILDQEGVQE